jgi:hypothetical protein
LIKIKEQLCLNPYVDRVQISIICTYKICYFQTNDYASMIHVDGASTVASNIPLKMSIEQQFSTRQGTLPSIYSNNMHLNQQKLLSSRPQTLQQNTRSIFSQPAAKLRSLSPPPNTPNTVNSFN